MLRKLILANGVAFAGNVLSGTENALEIKIAAFWNLIDRT